MRIAAFLLVAFHVFLCVSALVAKGKRKYWHKKQVVYLPFFLPAVGISMGSLLCIPTVLGGVSGQSYFYMFAAFVLFADSLTVAYLNCVICYDAEGFTAKNFFGITYHCGYAELEGIRSGRDSRVYFRGHSVLIDGMSNGYVEFVQALDKGYKKATGKWLPSSGSFKRRFDPMNGHVDHPWFYFILWIVLGLFFIAMPVGVQILISRETDPADLVTVQVRFDSYDIYDGTLRLYVQGDQEFYKIDYYELYEDALPPPEVLCGGEVYTVGTEGEHRYVMSLTAADGTAHITPETERQVYRASQQVAVWFLWCVMPFGVYFSYMGIATARHPERYSDKVKRLFYQDGYLH